MATRRARIGRPAPAGALAGKTALVTGGTRGIGRAIVEELHRLGCFVVTTGRDRKLLSQQGSQLGKQGMALACDVRSGNEVEELFQQIKKKRGRLDFLINNAGITNPPAPVEQMSVEAFEKVLDVNLTGTLRVTKSALPLMDRGGVIINNLSVAATRVFPGAAAYCASKFGALGLTNTLREELRERGIRVTALMPGPVSTGIWNVIWKEAPREKMATAEDVAHAVAAVLQLPEGATIESLHIGPTTGELAG